MCIRDRRSLNALLHVDLGSATENRFSFKTNLTERDYPDMARVDRFYDQLTSKLESLPGTLSIGAISYLPLSREGQSVTAAPAGAADGGKVSSITVGAGVVRGRYFETMGASRCGTDASSPPTIGRAPPPSPSWTT